MEITPIRTLRKDETKHIQLVSYNGMETIAKIYKFKQITDLTQVLKEVESLEKASKFKKSLSYYGSKMIETEKKYIILMEYCPQGDLCKFMNKKQTPFPEPLVWKHCKEFIELLAALQKIGICHRDIKPENIFVTQDEELKLADFGESKYQIMQNSLNTIRGSPLYLSPELLESYKLHSDYYKVAYNPFISDVFSLGLVLLVMTYMDPLSVNNNWRNKTSERSLSIRHPALRLIVYNMLMEDPSQRPDFLTLERVIYLLQDREICSICSKQYSDRKYLECFNCDYSIHYICGETLLTDFRCSGCYQILVLREKIAKIENAEDRLDVQKTEGSNHAEHLEVEGKDGNDNLNPYQEDKKEVKNEEKKLGLKQKNESNYHFEQEQKRLKNQNLNFSDKAKQEKIQEIEKSLKGVQIDKDDYQSAQQPILICLCCRICIYKPDPNSLECPFCDIQICPTCQLIHPQNEHCVNSSVKETVCICGKTITIDMSELFFTCNKCGTRCRFCSKLDISASHQSCIDSLSINNLS